MSGRTKKVAAALLVLAFLLIAVVGAAQAQTPDPANPPSTTPNRLQQMQERLGPEAWGQMIQRMTERHGAEATGQMLQRMASGEDCDGEGHAGMMGHSGMRSHSGGTMGRFSGMMNGFQRGMGGLMGSWH